MRCVDCSVEFTTQDALDDQIIEDDEGKHHRECADEGPAFTVTYYGSIWAFTEADGWTVDGQPYNPDDDGVHQPMTPAEEEEENERRRDHGDVPLPTEDPEGTVAFYEQMLDGLRQDGHISGDEAEQMVARMKAADRGKDWSPLMGRFPCTPHSVAGPRPRGSRLFAPLTDEEYPDPRDLSLRVRGRSADGVIFDDYEPGDRRVEQMEREEDRGRYDLEGR